MKKKVENKKLIAGLGSKLTVIKVFSLANES